MLIGLTGPAGCGKDALADQLVSYDVYEKYKFAGPIKAMLAQFHIRPDVWEDREAKEKIIPWLGKSPRYLAQTLGTEWGRHIVNPDIWVIMAKGRWNVLNASKKGRMVISDVRFENEAQWIKDAGGLVVNIDRLNYINKTDNRDHSSENGVPSRLIDLTIKNPGQEKTKLREIAWFAINNYLASQT